MMDNQNIAHFISQLRKSKNMTQKELAKKLYVTDKAISKWERGLGRPDISVLPLLADALNVTVEDILNGGIVLRTNDDTANATNYTEKVRCNNFTNKKNFFQKRYIKIIRFIPIIWACFFGFIGILYLVADLAMDQSEYLWMPVKEILLGLLTSWFILSSITALIPLILCYVWHRLSQIDS